MIHVFENKKEYTAISEVEKQCMICVIIRVENSDMYKVKKGRYHYKLPQFLSKHELSEFILFAK